MVRVLETEEAACTVETIVSDRIKNCTVTSVLPGVLSNTRAAFRNCPPDIEIYVWIEINIENEVNLNHN
jgi:hypothetical protein